MGEFIQVDWDDEMYLYLIKGHDLDAEETDRKETLSVCRNMSEAEMNFARIVESDLNEYERSNMVIEKIRLGEILVRY